MSTALKSPTEIMAHVPVDRFEIVNGPGATKCMEAQERLQRTVASGYVNVDFTLKTPASTSSFRRTLKVATIYNVLDGNFGFTAVFCGRVVSGIYDMQARTGWFNLD